MRHGERRKLEILDAGLRLWREQGEQAVSARGIAKVLGVTHSAVLYHWDTAGLKAAVASRAVATGCRQIVPQLIAVRHPAAAGLTSEQRSGYLGMVS